MQTAFLPRGLREHTPGAPNCLDAAANLCTAACACREARRLCRPSIVMADGAEPGARAPLRVAPLFSFSSPPKMEMRGGACFADGSELSVADAQKTVTPDARW